jgi:dTDP-4-dehydrorhamnose reductase
VRSWRRLAGERDYVRVVAVLVGAPTPARWIADTTASVLAQDSAPRTKPGRASAGVFNLVAGGRCSWFDLASAIVAGAAARGLIVRAPRMVPIATADFPTRARRPAWSVLDGSRLENAFGLQLADWRAGLDQVLDELAHR